jgi:type II secretory pathway component PulF
MDLPVLTEWLFHLSYRLVKMAVWVAGIFLGPVVIFAALAFSSKTKLAFGYWQLRLPVYNRWLRLRYTHFLFYQWGMLLKSGSPIIAALTSVEQVSPWVVLDDTIQKLRRTIERGYPLVDALEQVPFIPKQTLAAIAVAERTGILGERMLTVGEQSERQLEQYINRLTRWFEPLLLLVVGGLVGLIMILIFMPMLNFIQSM